MVLNCIHTFYLRCSSFCPALQEIRDLQTINLSCTSDVLISNLDPRYHLPSLSLLLAFSPFCPSRFLSFTHMYSILYLSFLFSPDSLKPGPKKGLRPELWCHSYHKPHYSVSILIHVLHRYHLFQLISNSSFSFN